MAGTTPIERKGINDVMAAFDLWDYPYFSMWCGKDLRFTWCGEDIEEGKGLLLQNLQVCERSGTTAIYTLKFHDELGKNNRIDSNTPIVASFNFRVCQPENYTGVERGVMRTDDRYIQHLQDEAARMKQEIEELKSREYVQDDIDDELGIVGKIGAAGERYPWMAESIKDILTMAKHYLLKIPGMGQQQQHQAQAINGIPDPTNMTREQKINTALHIMLKHNPDMADDLYRLAVLAESDIDTFNLAIKKLRQLA